MRRSGGDLIHVELEEFFDGTYSHSGSGDGNSLAAIVCLLKQITGPRLSTILGLPVDGSARACRKFSALSVPFPLPCWARRILGWSVHAFAIEESDLGKAVTSRRTADSLSSTGTYIWRKRINHGASGRQCRKRVWNILQTPVSPFAPCSKPHH